MADINWQAVVDHMREDVRKLQRALPLPKNEIATNAMVGTSALVLHHIADALQMGINKRNQP